MKQILKGRAELLALDDCHGPKARDLSGNPGRNCRVHNRIYVFVGGRRFLRQTWKGSGPNRDPAGFKLAAKLLPPYFPFGL